MHLYQGDPAYRVLTANAFLTAARPVDRWAEAAACMQTHTWAYVMHSDSEQTAAAELEDMQQPFWESLEAYAPRRRLPW